MARPISKRTPAADKTPVASGLGFSKWLLAGLLMLVTLGVYWPATHHEFVNYDDDQYVLENGHVTRGLSWDSARWALSSGYASNWHPLTWLSHMLDCQLFGLKPWGHHLTNVLFHALNAALVFLLFRQLTGASARSFWVAALFALHPLRVESVAWVAERKDVLSGFFGLLALLFYARYRTRRQLAEGPGRPGIDYALALLAFALGLMCKPMLVTWPFVMLLLDYWPLSPGEVRRMQDEGGSQKPKAGSGKGESPKSKVQGPKSKAQSPKAGGTSGGNGASFRIHDLYFILLEKLPFFALAAVVCVVTFRVQHTVETMSTLDDLPLGGRVENALLSYARYLQKLFWPADLAVFYPLPERWPMGLVLLAGGLLLAVSAAAWVMRKRTPYALVGWLWFVGTLVPVIGLVQVGGQSMADRYTYLPSIGIALWVVWGAGDLAKHWRLPGLAPLITGAAGVVLCLVLTRAQLAFWQDGEALFRHALAVTENNSMARVNLGTALGKKGRAEEAMSQFQEALRLAPDAAEAHNGLGLTLVMTGRTPEAIPQFEEALRLKPGYAAARQNLEAARAVVGGSSKPSDLPAQP